MSAMKTRARVGLSGVLAAALFTLSGAGSALASPYTVDTIPDFIIPVDDKHGTLSIDKDSNITQSGFDVLGSQVFQMAAGSSSSPSTSSGTMTLNIEFPGFSVPSGSIISGASLMLTVFDFDFFNDIITSHVDLLEVALFNGENLVAYLPNEIDVWTETDEQEIMLDPIQLLAPTGPFEASELALPFTLSFLLEATLTNTGSKIWLMNTPESVVASIGVTVVSESGIGEPVPEPSTLLLFGTALIGVAIQRRRVSVVRGPRGQGVQPRCYQVARWTTVRPVQWCLRT